MENPQKQMKKSYKSVKFFVDFFLSNSLDSGYTFIPYGDYVDSTMIFRRKQVAYQFCVLSCQISYYLNNLVIYQPSVSKVHFLPISGKY